MDNKRSHDDSHEDSKAQPIVELKDFALEGDPEFPQRVKRSLDRHVLVGDSLEFSLDMFQKTMWEYVRTIIEQWPPAKGAKSE